MLCSEYGYALYTDVYVSVLCEAQQLFYRAEIKSGDLLNIHFT
jgi:hypothetical protein